MTLPTYDEFRAASLEQKKELFQTTKLHLIKHRFQDHHDETLTVFHDCAYCGLLENRIHNFEEELYA